MDSSFLSSLLDFLLSGLGLGAIYALIALGYSMVYGILKLINFAHGEFFMLGAYAGYFVLSRSGIERLALPHPLPILLSFLAALAAASLSAATLAVVTERIAYRPLRRAGRTAPLITAVCASLILQNLAIKAWSATPRAYPEPRQWAALAQLSMPLADDWRVVRAPGPVMTQLATTQVVTTRTDDEWDHELRAGATLDAETLERLRADGHDVVYRTVALGEGVKRGLVVLALVLSAPALWLLVMRTRMGRAMRAISEDSDAARLMGIDVDRVVSWTFFVGALVAGVGGVAYCVVAGKVDPLVGFLPGLKAFVAAVVGGIGSIPGAVLGGLVLGVTESVVPFLIQRITGWPDAFAWKDAMALVLMIAVLLFRPAGLLGRPQRERV